MSPLQPFPDLTPSPSEGVRSSKEETERQAAIIARLEKDGAEMARILLGRDKFEDVR
jgi:uncharacterized protein with GYD domain